MAAPAALGESVEPFSRLAVTRERCKTALGEYADKRVATHKEFRNQDEDCHCFEYVQRQWHTYGQSFGQGFVGRVIFGPRRAVSGSIMGSSDDFFCSEVVQICKHDHNDDDTKIPEAAYGRTRSPQLCLC